MRIRLLFAATLLVAVMCAVPAAASAAPTCTSAGTVAVVSGESIVLTADCPGATSWSIVPGGGPAHGTLSNLGPGTATYTANSCYGGADGFQYTASDADGTTTMTVSINVTRASGCPANNPPVCSDLEVGVPAGGQVPLAAGCTDPEGDPLQYSLVAAPDPSLGFIGGPLDGALFSYVNVGGLPGTWDTFTYKAYDGVSDSQVAEVRVLIVGTTSEAGPIAAGGTFSTGTTPSGSTPVVTELTSPAAGRVGVVAEPTAGTAPAGYTLFGSHLEIAAPPATAQDPLVLRFTLDTTDPTGVTVLRDGEPITSSCDPAVLPGAGPDPCADVGVNLAGYVTVTVRTSHASGWDFARRPVYDWHGFFNPVDNLDVLNTVKAGSSVPVKFALAGDQGLDVLAEGYPRSRAIDCDTSAKVDAIETTTTSPASLRYDATAERYVYVWKTPSAPGTCRQLVVKLADDTVHRANFKLR